MTPSSGRTPVRKSNDGPNQPTIMHTTPSAHTSGKHARLGEATLRGDAYKACIDGGTLPQTVPAVQVLHQVKQGLSLAPVRYGRVIAPRLDRGQRHPSSQHRSTEAVGLQGHAEPVGALGQSIPLFPVLGSAARPNPFQPLNTAWRRDVGASGLLIGASQDLSAEVLPFELIRVPLDLAKVNGRARLGEMLAHALVEAIDDEDVLDLSAEETAAEPEHGLAFLQLVVLGSQLGHGEAQLGRAVDEVVDQPAPARPRETEGLLKFFLCLLLHNQIPRLLLHGIGGNRSVVSVDQRVLVDLRP